MTDLRERVANLLWDELSDEMTYEQTLPVVDAVRALIVEECAKVAEAKGYGDQMRDRESRGFNMAKRDIAAAIRALATKDGEDV